MREFDVDKIKVIPLKKIIFGLLIVVALITTIVQAGNIGETNKAGFIQVKQVAFYGDLEVKFTPGFWWQNFGYMDTYQLQGDIFLSKDVADGGDDATAQAVRVQFPNGYADVNFVGAYELPLDTMKVISLHLKYNEDIYVKNMVKQQIIEALKNTGTLMSAEEAYSDKRSDFTRLVYEQTLNGLYKSKVTRDTIIDKSGQKTIRSTYSVATDKDGKPIISKVPLLSTFGITLPQFNVKDMDFDQKLMDLIEARKDAQKAKQAAITAKAEGESRIATEKANQEVEKMKQVTIAEKEAAVAKISAEKEAQVAKIDAEKKFKVAEFKAKQSLEEKKATIAKGQAEAEANRLKVKAGLSPQEKATFKMNTAIGVAAEVAKSKPGVWTPNVMITNGGTGKGGTSLAEQSFGINMMLSALEKIEQVTTKVTK